MTSSSWYLTVWKHFVTGTIENCGWITQMQSGNWGNEAQPETWLTEIIRNTTQTRSTGKQHRKLFWFRCSHQTSILPTIHHLTISNKNRLSTSSPTSPMDVKKTRHWFERLAEVQVETEVEIGDHIWLKRKPPVAPPPYVKRQLRHETTCLLNWLHPGALSVQQEAKATRSRSSKAKESSSKPSRTLSTSHLNFSVFVLRFFSPLKRERARHRPFPCPSPSEPVWRGHTWLRQ